jgi:hypothetical protein
MAFKNQNQLGLGTVVHNYNPSYSEGGEEDDCGLRSVRAKR